MLKHYIRLILLSMTPLIELRGAIPYSQLVDLPIIKSYIKQLWAICNVAISCVLFNFLSYKFTFSGWIDWLIGAVVIGIISCVVTLGTSLIFYREDLKNLLGKFLRRRRVHG